MEDFDAEYNDFVQKNDVILAGVDVDIKINELWDAFNTLFLIGGENSLSEEDADLWYHVTLHPAIQRRISI